MGSTPNPNWPRWIWASIIKHLASSVFTPNSIPFIAEGVDERTDDFMSENNRAEIRMNGPQTRELSADYWRLWVDINVLVISYMDGQLDNAYTLETNLGLVLEAMDTVIPINRLGDGPNDDGNLLGCLSPRLGDSDSVKIIQFGQVHKVDRIKEGVVDGRFKMYLST